jgi:hypothetical protein
MTTSLTPTPDPGGYLTVSAAQFLSYCVSECFMPEPNRRPDKPCTRESCRGTMVYSDKTGTRDEPFVNPGRVFPEPTPYRPGWTCNECNLIEFVDQ